MSAPETTHERLTRVLGCISGAKGILRGGAHFTDAMALEYLEDASETLRGVLAEMDEVSV